MISHSRLIAALVCCTCHGICCTYLCVQSILSWNSLLSQQRKLIEMVDFPLTVMISVPGSNHTLLWHVAKDCQADRSEGYQATYLRRWRTTSQAIHQGPQNPRPQPGGNRSGRTKKSKSLRLGESHRNSRARPRQQDVRQRSK